MIAEHIAKALDAVARDDDDARWDHVCALHRDGSADALAAALSLCESDAPAERQLGADILAQLGGASGERPYRDQSAPVVLRLLHDTHPGVVASAVSVRPQEDRFGAAKVC